MISLVAPCFILFGQIGGLSKGIPKKIPKKFRFRYYTNLPRFCCFNPFSMHPFILVHRCIFADCALPIEPFAACCIAKFAEQSQPQFQRNPVNHLGMCKSLVKKVDKTWDKLQINSILALSH